MKFNLIETKEILDLEKEIGYELEVNERPVSAASAVGTQRFYVYFKEGEVMQGGCLIGSYGNGNTIDEALKDYAKQISCTRMAFGAYTPNRKEISFPKLVHTKMLNQ